MGRSSYPHRWAGAGDGMSKSVSLARIRKIGKEFDAEALALVLEKSGASASACLLPDDERNRRWKSADQIRIPIEVADKIAAVLFSAPRKQKKGRRSDWSQETLLWAVIALSNDQPVNELAREISEKIGQPFASVRRRLQEVKGGDLRNELKAHLEQQARRLGAKYDMVKELKEFLLGRGLLISAE
jgi:hypothetical protein